MVLLVLYVKAELENVASITFPRNLQWCFDVKDAQSDESKEGVFVCAEDVAEVDGSKGDANFAMRFPDCKKQCTITFDEVKKLCRDTTATNAPDASGGPALERKKQPSPSATGRLAERPPVHAWNSRIRRKKGKTPAV